LGSFRLALLAEEGSAIEDAWGYAVPRGIGVVGAIQSTMIVTSHAVNLCGGGAGPPVDMRGVFLRFRSVRRVIGILAVV
jgi:hypothetical protein